MGQGDPSGKRSVSDQTRLAEPAPPRLDGLGQAILLLLRWTEERLGAERSKL